MDTRTKIVERTELGTRLHTAPVWVSGHFDPLLSEHVRRLALAREPGRPLVVEVTDPRHPLLSQRARAELVAALSMVDFVVLGGGGTAVDPDLTQRFVEHVLERHRQELGRQESRRRESSQ